MDRVVVVYVDDWSAIYVNGASKCQNHNIRVHDVEDIMGQNPFILETIEVDNKWAESGNLPTYLDNML